MGSIDLKEVEKRRILFSTPLDVEKYISEGVISRYKNTKTQFVIHSSKGELPEEISARAYQAKSIPNKDGTNTLVFTLNLKVRK